MEKRKDLGTATEGEKVSRVFRRRKRERNKVHVQCWMLSSRKIRSSSSSKVSWKLLLKTGKREQPGIYAFEVGV